MRFRSITRRAVQRLLCLLLMCFLVAQACPAPDVSALAQPSGTRPLQGVPRFEPAACMFNNVAGLEEGRQVQCGYLVVPEMYENPGGRTIRLAVVIFKARSGKAAPTPLFLLQGGPGGSTIDLYTQLLPLNPQIWENRDVVLFDQRGTKYSQPFLSCPEYFDMTVANLDKKLSDEESNRQAQESMRACRQRLTASGVNLGAYNSLESSNDIDALRQSLGYAQIDLYGNSYGTLLALHTLRFHPQILRTLILDSVVPPNIDVFNNVPRTENRAFEALFSACAADPACNRSFPNLRQVFYDTVDRLNASPAQITLTDPETNRSYQTNFDGDFLLSSLFQLMYVTEIIPFLPRAIYDARAGNFDFLTRVLSLLEFDRSIGYGMYFSVNCSEDGDITPQPDSLKDLPPQIVQVEDNSVSSYLAICALWNVPALGPEMDAPVQSDLPVLLFSGQFDPATPAEYAQEVARGLPNSYSFLFPWGGHVAVGSSDCSRDILLAFLDNPSRKPDDRCIAAHGGVDFITPGSLVPLPVVARLLPPQGSTLVELVLYVLALFFLLTALILYPLVWLVRVLRRRPVTPALTQNAPAPRPLLYRLAPWLAGAAAFTLLVFTLIIVGVFVNMIVNNDLRYLAGLPGSTRPVFALPLLAGLLIILMPASAAAGWLHKSGSTLGRVYFTLLAVAGLICLVILGLWGMLTGLFA